MKRADCRSELVMRSRRQTLSDTEQALLDAHLAMCETCRFDRQIGVTFDEVSGLHPGYEMRDERMAAAVLRRVQPSLGWRAGRRSSWLRPAIVLGFVGATVAAWAGARAGLGGAHRAAVVAGPSASVCVEGASCGNVQGFRSAEPEPLVLAPSLDGAGAPPPEPNEPTTASRRHRGGHHRVQAKLDGPVEGASAEALFARATLERQRKRAAEAIELYAELQRRYPLSPEARVSEVSLGRLLFDHGMPADASTQFDAYLAAAPGGPLAPEALFGKARALDALGRRDDAREVWRRVATDLPGSAYAAEARRHLDAQP